MASCDSLQRGNTGEQSSSIECGYDNDAGDSLETIGTDTNMQTEEASNKSSPSGEPLPQLWYLSLALAWRRTVMHGMESFEEICAE